MNMNHDVSYGLDPRKAQDPVVLTVANSGTTAAGPEIDRLNFESCQLSVILGAFANVGADLDITFTVEDRADQADPWAPNNDVSLPRLDLSGDPNDYDGVQGLDLVEVDRYFRIVMNINTISDDGGAAALPIAATCTLGGANFGPADGRPSEGSVV